MTGNGPDIYHNTWVKVGCYDSKFAFPMYHSLALDDPSAVTHSLVRLILYQSTHVIIYESTHAHYHKRSTLAIILVDESQTA